MAKTDAYYQAYLKEDDRLDEAAAKCGPGSKSCGTYCIPKDQTCGGKKKKKTGKGSAIAAGVALAGAAALASRRSQSGKPQGAIEIPENNVPGLNRKKALVVGVAAGGAVGLGVTAAVLNRRNKEEAARNAYQLIGRPNHTLAPAMNPNNLQEAMGRAASVKPISPGTLSKRARGGPLALRAKSSSGLLLKPEEQTMREVKSGAGKIAKRLGRSAGELGKVLGKGIKAAGKASYKAGKEARKTISGLKPPKLNDF